MWRWQGIPFISTFLSREPPKFLDFGELLNIGQWYSSLLVLPSDIRYREHAYCLIHVKLVNITRHNLSWASTWCYFLMLWVLKLHHVKMMLLPLMYKSCINAFSCKIQWLSDLSINMELTFDVLSPKNFVRLLNLIINKIVKL